MRARGRILPPLLLVLLTATAACLVQTAAATHNYTCFKSCAEGDLSKCEMALAAEHQTWYVDTASNHARIEGVWREVSDNGSLSVTSSSPYLNGYFLTDNDENKGNKRITFTVQVPLPGSYKVTLLHPASDVAATAVPVDITVFEDGAMAAGYDRSIDQRSQTRPKVGGSVIGTFNTTSHVVVTVSTTNTHVETENPLGNHVLVDGLLLEPVHVDVCGLLTTTTTTTAAPTSANVESTSASAKAPASTTTATTTTTTGPEGLGSGSSSVFFQSSAFIIVASAGGFMMMCSVLVLFVICRRSSSAVGEKKHEHDDKRVDSADEEEFEKVEIMDSMA